MRDSRGNGQRHARARETHYEQAKQDLEVLVSRLAAEGEAKLPAEDQLALDLGFSRPTVRSALLALQSEGKIQRLHGVGTFINRHALRIDANLAEDRPFFDIIESLGFEASIEIVHFAEERLPASVLKRIGTTNSEHGVVIDRLFRASGEPAVLSRDYVPAAALTAPASQLTAERSTFAFVQRWADRRVRYSVTAIRAMSAITSVSDTLKLPAGSPVLLLDHLHIDERDEPVGVTESYINDRFFTFTVIRASGEL